MAQRRRGERSRDSYEDRAHYDRTVTDYVYGNTAHDLEVRKQINEGISPVPDANILNNRNKERGMTAGYVLFLVAALSICAIVLIEYVQLQSKITSSVKHIAKQEQELNNLQLKNEESYNKIIGSIDLEEVRKVAIGELGMTYAQEGQIVTYTSARCDYMRKVLE